MCAAKKARPDVLHGVTRKIPTALGKLYVTISEDAAGTPLEMFVTIGKAGAPLVADAEAIGRLVSLALRHDIEIEEIRQQLRGISSDRPLGVGDATVLSLPDAVAIAIERWQEAHTT